MIRVPGKYEFGKDAYAEADDLQSLGQQVIQKLPRLTWLSGYSIQFLWKGKGGNSGGNDVLGKCTLPGPVVKHFVPFDWIVWIAADHIRMREYTDTQIEALVAHELMHCALAGPDDDPRPAVRGHDVGLFLDEVRTYGAWRESLQQASNVFEQMALPGVLA